TIFYLSSQTCERSSERYDPLPSFPENVYRHLTDLPDSVVTGRGDGVNQPPGESGERLDFESIASVVAFFTQLTPQGLLNVELYETLHVAVNRVFTNNDT